MDMGTRARRQEEETFTTAEAAAILSLAESGPAAPVTKRAVDSILQKRLFPAVVVRRRKGRRALTALAIRLTAAELELRRELPVVPLRRRIYEHLAKGKTGPIKATHAVSVDVMRPIRNVARAMKRYRQLMRHIEVNPEIQGGEPVIRGTRVTAHTIAEIARQGTPTEEILRHYPALNEEQVEAARLYAKAHPRRGRPVLPSKGKVVLEEAPSAVG
jgi:uncharacterized protein (DUF433 family)